MVEYWNNMPLLSQVFVMLAAPSTLILLIQTILLFFGGDAGDTGMDSDVSGIGDGIAELQDGDLDYTDHDTGSFDQAGLRLFSIRGIFAFLAVGGWSGLLCAEAGVPAGFSIIIAFLLGFAALYGLAKLMQAMVKLQESGTLDYRNGLGKKGQVYLTIPAKNGGKGKINVEINGQLGEFSAVTESASPIPTGTIIRVIDLIGDVFVVEMEE